jgi:hypothetical protein
MKPRYLSPKQYAELFGLTADHVSRSCKAGLIPGAVRPVLGGQWRIPVEGGHVVRSRRSKKRAAVARAKELARQQRTTASV